MSAGCHGHRRVWLVSRGLLVVALLASGCSAPRTTSGPAPQGPLQGTAPAGAVTPPFSFAWQGNAAGGVVQISVEDRARRPVFSFPARARRRRPRAASPRC